MFAAFTLHPPQTHTIVTTPRQIVWTNLRQHQQVAIIVGNFQTRQEFGALRVDRSTLYPLGSPVTQAECNGGGLLKEVLRRLVVRIMQMDPPGAVTVRRAPALVCGPLVQSNTHTVERAAPERGLLWRDFSKCSLISHFCL